MNRALAVFLVSFAAAAAAALASPGAALRPGRLLPGHAALEDDCLACHEPLAGARRGRCVACHAPDSVGTRTAAGLPAREPREAVAALHRSLGERECADCHAEHSGRLSGGRAARFDHDAFPADLRADCAACHARGRPEDDLHRAAGPACASCHAPAAWRPSTFDHSNHFRFDRDHRPRCADCHAPGRALAEYSCTGCHEHGLARMEEKHRREGVADVARCARCHRTADEHDARAPDEGGRRRGDGEGEDHEEERR